MILNIYFFSTLRFLQHSASNRERRAKKVVLARERVCCRRRTNWN
nr:hypothetical protein B0391.7 - Caenorhabditis elegans [Caenorhabditis elegans]